MNAPLKKKPIPSRSVSGTQEDFRWWFDYRQIPFWRFLLPNGWTLVAKIDKAVVLRSLVDHLPSKIFFGQRYAFADSLLMYLFQLASLLPEGIGKYRSENLQGDVTARVVLITKDEFGELGKLLTK